MVEVGEGKSNSQQLYCPQPFLEFLNYEIRSVNLVIQESRFEKPCLVNITSFGNLNSDLIIGIRILCDGSIHGGKFSPILKFESAFCFLVRYWSPKMEALIPVSLKPLIS